MDVSAEGDYLSGAIESLADVDEEIRNYNFDA
jgi:hypothetical protein